MSRIQLSKKTYLDKVYGCWLGKNIGGTLGAPYESKKYACNLTFYEPVPEKPMPNDDLDLQLVWLKMLEDRGVKNVRMRDFADYWLANLKSYPWDEYGYCQRNLKDGLVPPVSGCFENTCIDNMGSPIRSEIWACIAPANPQAAAEMAFKDAVLDHAGGEGVYGEMFWAAVESAAFVEADPRTLIQIGLSMIPLHCQTSRVIREVLVLKDRGALWGDLRNWIAEKYSNPSYTPNHVGSGLMHPCHAVPNIGFTIIGWLYGTDFGDKLLKAVNCGYDTDCTGATLGAVMGIIDGANKIPMRWRNPIGENIILHKFTCVPNAPKSVKELTTRVAKLAEQFMANDGAVSLGAKNKIPANVLSILSLNEKALQAVAACDPQSAIEHDRDLEITLHYNGEPVLPKGVVRRVSVSLKKNGKPVKAQVALAGSAGLKVTSARETSFDLFAKDAPLKNTLTVTAKLAGRTYAASFVLLGPAVKRWATGEYLPICKTCGGYMGFCACQ